MADASTSASSDAAPRAPSLRSDVFTADALMLGGAPLGSLFSSVSSAQALATVDRALELGIRRFDTAPLYGVGLSETYMGEALQLSEGRVDFWTKVGRLIKPRASLAADDVVDEAGMAAYDVGAIDDVIVFDYSEAGVRKSVQDSLRRTGLRQLTGVRVHDCETEERYAQATAPGAAIDTLVRMRQEGTIRYVSVGVNTPSFLIRLAEAYPRGTFDSFLIAGSWNLLDQSALELLSVCEDRGIRLTNGGVFGSGILWGGDTLRYTKASPEAVERVRRWEALCAEFHQPLPAVALHFSLMPAIVDYACIGCRSPQEVSANVRLLSHRVPAALWGEAKRRGLLPGNVPTPAV